VEILLSSPGRKKGKKMGTSEGEPVAGCVENRERKTSECSAFLFSGGKREN